MSKSFGTHQVLKDVSLEVADGEFCILLGPSGCGKSTILRLIAGLDKADGGAVSIGGQPVDHLQPRARDVAFVFQNYALYPHMTVRDNLAFSLRLRRTAKDQIASQVKDTARLLEIESLLERLPQELSGGQRQRVALGRAIVRQPRIFLFDEPLSNLDATLRATMRVELARLHRRLGATILYVTHDQAEALTLGEKIVVLHRGAVQQVGSPSEVYHKPSNTDVATFIGTPQMNLIDGRLDEAGLVFRSASFSLDCMHGLGKTLARIGGGPLTLGIRPEDFKMTAAEHACIRGKIEFIEDLGSDRFVHLRCGDVLIIARAGPEETFHVGDTVGFGVAAGRIHFFRDGKRIEP